MLSDDLAQVLIEDHPYETAHVLERLDPAAAWQALAGLEPALRPRIVEGFTDAFAARLLTEAGHEEALFIIRELPSEVSADILAYLPESQADDLLAALPSLHAEEIETLADYPEDSAGSIMSPEFVALRQQATVQDALTRLRRMAAVGRSVNYVYVVDEDDRLRGVLMMRDLVLAQPTTPLRSIMIGNVVKTYTTTDIRDVSEQLLERRLLALPVVDEDDVLRGVIIATQLVSELQEEGFEDAQKLFGAGADEHATSSSGFAIRKRLPWLSVNLLTAFLAAAVVGAFDGIIAQLTILAALLPVVAGQSGNAGAQALAVTLRSLALDDLDTSSSKRILQKEAVVGLANGLVTGALAAGAGVLVSGSLGLGLVILAAMVFNLMVAGVAGAGIPLLLERLGQDPAQSANIVLTTVTDVIGFGSFLGLALLLRPLLLA